MSVKDLILLLANMVSFAILARIVVSWLQMAGMRSEFVSRVDYALSFITEPVMRPLRRVIPTFGSMDFTPVVAIALLNMLLPVVLNRIF